MKVKAEGYDYYSLSCDCTIEVRPSPKEGIGLLETKACCSRCGSEIKLRYFKHICTPGFGNIHENYLLEQIEKRKEIK